MWFQKKFLSIFYFFLRNDLVWSLLDSNQRKIIKENNFKFNNEREDYKNIDLFGKIRQSEGERWDTYNYKKIINLINNRSLILDKSRDLIFILKHLENIKPKNILEVGCGPGFFSKALYDFSSTEKLYINDINKNFIDYVVSQEKKEIKRKKLESHTGDILKFQNKDNIKFDLIVFCRSLHHIPDRIEVFEHLEKMLNIDGCIIACEPSNYLRRYYWQFRTVFKKCFSDDFLSDISNFGTHHFCTHGEFRKIEKKIPNLEILKIEYNKEKNFNVIFLRRIFSLFIYSIFRKKL